MPWEIDPSKCHSAISADDAQTRIPLRRKDSVDLRNRMKNPAMDRACYHLGELSIRGSKFSAALADRQIELVFS